MAHATSITSLHVVHVHYEDAQTVLNQRTHTIIITNSLSIILINSKNINAFGSKTTFNAIKIITIRVTIKIVPF